MWGFWKLHFGQQGSGLLGGKVLGWLHRWGRDQASGRVSWGLVVSQASRRELCLHGWKGFTGGKEPQGRKKARVQREEGRCTWERTLPGDTTSTCKGDTSRGSFQDFKVKGRRTSEVAFPGEPGLPFREQQTSWCLVPSSAGKVSHEAAPPLSSLLGVWPGGCAPVGARGPGLAPKSKNYS